MKFFIYPQLDGRTYEIMVEHFDRGWNAEEFKVHGKNLIVIESNRPLFRNKKIMKRRPDYKLASGTFDFKSYEDKIVEEIDNWVKKNLDS